MSPSVWQVSGGPLNRDYTDLFIRHGVALIGPGDAGPYDPRAPAAAENVVGRFATELQAGDVLVLRKGLASIGAVGIAAGAYQYLPQFDDVNGWDLQHARRVRWYALPDLYTFDTSVFGANAPRFARTNHPAVVDYALRFVNSPPDHWKTAPLPALPPEAPPLEVVPAWLQPLLAQVQDLIPCYQNSAAFGDRPGENELIVHYVVPLLRALGWPVEQIAVQWRCVDVCVFSKLPRVPENIRFLIEAKRLGGRRRGGARPGVGLLARFRRPTRCDCHRWHPLPSVCRPGEFCAGRFHEPGAIETPGAAHAEAD